MVPEVSKDRSEANIQKEWLASSISMTCLGHENPSQYTAASARGCAKISAIMANKGSFEGKTLMSNDAWDKMHSGATTEKFWDFGYN